ncbi:N-acetylglucosamine-6-phosphate deacetylase [Pseudonocardia sp. K10HN5]|uniref:N-acetylglucosamine-6-phosphate deacetylase n=1 Tax=Pseudonocardia acidicola TaxID=2724939 RepID=A0ABX1S998_9PSEU|nr:N-acetylglucosamine-6-phosphate deacetylase [Pseudonocardia acidicola]
MTVLYGASIVTPDEIITEGWIATAGARIDAIGRGAPPATDAQNLGGGFLVPAFIDIHCHGGAGADFGSADAEQVDRAARYHRNHGTGGMLASLVTAPIEELCKQLAVIADIVESADTPLLGAHLEGPFLSQMRCGAQNPAFLTAPDVSAFRKMVDVSRGTLKMITIAPELPGAGEVVEAARAAGVVAALGHTDATFAQAATAIVRGASVATHLFNGMRPLRHRDPGPVLASLDSGIACEVINDGVHVHAAITRMVAERDPSQLVLVTDAISATGMGDGQYTLGGQPVLVENGQARLASSGSLAGSTLTMDVAVRRAVVECGLPLEVAVAAASTNPARVLGESSRRGRIAAGLAADLVHLDDELQVKNVICGGRRQP